MGFRLSSIVVFLATFVCYSLQACTDGQYDDPAIVDGCLDCALPCALCTGAAVCTTCASPDMLFAAPNCNFCADNEFTNAGVCTSCDAACGGKCEGSAAGCTVCPAGEVLDLVAMTCRATGFACPVTSITIDGQIFCRIAMIYVDPSSTSPSELGTMAHPYKTIDQAFIEIFNYWPRADNPVKVLVKEATLNKVYFQERPLVINRKDNVEITTYKADGTVPGEKANLQVTNTELYATVGTTRYSLVSGKDYDYAGVGSDLTTAEKAAIDTQWYTFVIVQSHFKIDGFKVDNVLKLEDDDFAIVHPISNLLARTLTIDNCHFINYGTAMYTTTSIGFSSTAVVIETPRLVGGFVFLVSCTDPLTEVVTGEVVIDNLNFTGTRSVLFKYGGIYMTGTQNFTIINSYIGSYGFMFDAKQLTRADSPLNCQPDDNVKQIIRLESNVYDMLTEYTGTPHHGFICSFLEWYPRKDMEVFFINNTMQNIAKSFYRVLLLDVKSAVVNVENNLFKDTTGSVDISQIDTTKDVFIRNNTFQNISSTSQNIIVIASSSNVVITDFKMNGANPEQVSSSIINLNMADNAVATLNDIKFTDNIFLGTKAIVSQQLLSIFDLTNSSFSGDQIMQNTNYIDIQLAKKISITDTNFTGITYQNVDDSGAYLIYIAKEQSDAAAEHSYVERIRFSNIKTNAISFGGFEDSVTGAGGNLYIKDVDFIDSIFSSPDSLISTKKFSYTGASKMIITETRFTNLEFTTFGNLIHLTHNAKEPFEILLVTFTSVYGAGILLEPQDIFDKTNPLTLTIVDCTFTSNTPWVAGFINVFENSIVHINTSIFTNTSSGGSGSVVLANYKENSVIIRDSNFTNNYAILGGVFYSQFSSVITCINCRFNNNIAIRGGVAFLNSNGNINLQQSDLTLNQALNAPSLYISACQAEFSVVSSSDIYNNNVITMEQLLARSAARTDHIIDAYIQEVQDNRIFYEKSVSGSKKSAISMIKGKLRVNENTRIFNQIDFLGTFESEIEIIDTLFENVTLDTNHIIFHLLSSTFTYTNSTMNNVTCPNQDEAMFQVRLESTFRTRGKNAKITNTNCQFAFLLYSTAEIYDITFDTANLLEAHVDSIESNLEFRETTLRNVNTSAEALMAIENSASLVTTSAFFLSSNKFYFSVTGSTLTFFNTTFQNDLNQNIRAAIFEECNVNINNSTLQNLNYNVMGGAIDTLNSQVNVIGGLFFNNTAPQGGAIAFRCEEGNTCKYNITEVTFRQNNAATDGGAMYYDFYKPITNNNIYENNVANYGPNLAGFPVKIEIDTLPSQTYVSGQQIAQEIKYKLVDHDGLTIATDSDSVITISPVVSTDKVIGNTDVTVEKGVATFKDVTFISSPGAQAVSYTVSSSNIDENKISTSFGMTLDQTIQTLTLDFRQCIVGEEQTNDQCIPCPTGKYSLIVGNDECKICPKHATCLGRDEIEVDKGYWRSSFSSDVIHECLNLNACLQYDFAEALTTPNKCKDGYASNLCQQCVKIGDDQYQRTGDNGCGVCPDIVLNAFRLLGLLLLLVIFVVIIIWSNIRTQKDSESAILIRILANYFQIITSAASFNLTFPDSLDGFFQGVKAVGDSAKIFLSIDCFVQDVPMVKDTGTTEYFKAFMSGISPFIFIGVVFACWGVVRIFKNYSWMQLKNRIIISVCVVLFLLHPSITGMSLGLFNCFEIDDGEFWLFKDLSVKCWSGSHTAYAFGLGVIMILTWVIGLPLFGFFVIRHYRNRLEEEFVIFRYRILFQGYKREAYYWEFVNIFRKISIVMINTFLGIYPPIYKTFVATLTLAIILRQQEQIQPYKIKIMNEVEFRESTASIVTLFGGMFFILEDLPGVIRVLLVIVIFITNFWFYSLWIHMFFKRSKFSTMRLIAYFFGKLSCLGKEYWSEEHKTMQSNHDMDFVFGKYDAKDTKYNKVEEESKDASFQGYAQGDNIINDLSAGDTGSLKEKEKANMKDVDDKTGKGEATAVVKKKGKKKKKKIIRKKKKKGAKKEGDDGDEPEEEGVEQDEVEQEINQELDQIDNEQEIDDDVDLEAEAEPEQDDAPKPKKKKVRRKKKKTARKDEKVEIYPEQDPDKGSKSPGEDPDDFSADEEADEI